MLQLKAPSGPLKGTISLSGSKSISNRLLILRFISGNAFNISNLSDSEDTRLLATALEHVKPGGAYTFDMHHAGTSVRFLTALLSTVPGQWILTGSDRLKQRPLHDLVEALKDLGAQIEYAEINGRLPIKITGKTLSGGTVNVTADVSSQFLSALLLIAPRLKNGLTIRPRGELVSRPYLDMTLQLLKRAGAELSDQSSEISCKASDLKFKDTVPVEADWSAASYYYSICALRPGSEIHVKGLSSDSLQGDSKLAVIYQPFGVSTEHNNQGIIIRSKKVPSLIFNYNFKDCPDIAQTLAISCAGLGMEARLEGLKTLKIKESDRIEALKAELSKMNLVVRSTNDSLAIEPLKQPGQLKTDQTIDTCQDHRMAMSFAPLSLITGQVFIDDPNVVNKSYPSFWKDLISLGFSVNLTPQ